MHYRRIAHRGFAAVAKENSLAAIEGAFALGCDDVEVDVRRRADGALVLHHESGDVPGAATLEQALRALAPSAAGLMLDLKEPGTADEVAALVDEHAARSRIIVSGLPGEALRVKALRPATLAGRTLPSVTGDGYGPLEHLVCTPQRMLLGRRLDALLHGFDVLVAFHRVLDRRVVERAESAGCAVYAWTVDDRRRIARLSEWGVAGVISDDPASFA
jgi:glycerophosphoryl diester phosphodiesterase